MKKEKVVKLVPKVEPIENKVEWDDIVKATDALCDLIKNYDHKSDAANYACYQIICWASENHFEGIGILTETMLSWREESLAVMDEEVSK